MAATLIQSRIRAMAVRKLIQQKREAAHKATRIFFLVGGPGSGKSTYGKRLTNEFGAPTAPLTHSLTAASIAFSRSAVSSRSVGCAPTAQKALSSPRSASKRC